MNLSGLALDIFHIMAISDVSSACRKLNSVA
jgi:hypothetical protein